MVRCARPACVDSFEFDSGDDPPKPLAKADTRTGRLFHRVPATTVDIFYTIDKMFLKVKYKPLIRNKKIKWRKICLSNIHLSTEILQVKNFARTTLATCALLLSTAAMAAPVSLGSVEHLYGSSTGRQLSSVMDIYHPGGNCDTATANAITVKATKASTCNRFADAFDFSSIDYDSIDRFELTLVFTGARNQGLMSSERWNVRGASNYVQSATNFGATLNANGTQTFSFDSSQKWFADILSANTFMISFATNSGAASNFNLSSARLEVFGTAAVAEVPEPGSLALMGLSLAALVGVRRVRKAKTV